MISLNVYFTPKPGKDGDLESAIRDKWVAAMSEQPGFLRAAILKPFPEDDLARLQAIKPQSALEVVAFWRSEDERAAWVARPIHNQVFLPLLELSDRVTYTVQTVEHAWEL